MHEMGIVLNIVRTANRFAEENNAKGVKKLRLEIGEASPVLPQYVEMFFRDVIPDYKIMEHCKLEIERKKALLFCLECGESYGLDDNDGKCPKCSARNYKILEGNQIFIKNMEIV